MKHTPGPWELSEGQDDYRMDIIADGRIIGHVCTDHYGEANEHEIADGVLMTAAPDMLEALQEIREALSGFDGISESMHEAQLETFWAITNEAINKATRKEEQHVYAKDT